MVEKRTGLQIDAQVGVGGRPRLDELLGNLLGQLDGDGETDADTARAAALAGAGASHRGDRAGDTDDPALLIEQGAAGVTGVDGGIDLDGVGVDRRGRRAAARAALTALSLGVDDRAVQRRDDAGGNRGGQAQRVADRHDVLAGGQSVGVAELGDGEVIGSVLELDDRQVGGGVGAGGLGVVDAAVGQSHLDLRRDRKSTV